MNIYLMWTFTMILFAYHNMSTVQQYCFPSTQIISCSLHGTLIYRAGSKKKPECLTFYLIMQPEQEKIRTEQVNKQNPIVILKHYLSIYINMFFSVLQCTVGEFKQCFFGNVCCKHIQKWQLLLGNVCLHGKPMSMCHAKWVSKELY